MDPISCIASGFALYQLLQSIKDLLDIGLAVKDASPKATALFKSLQLLADAISKVRDASNVVIFDEMSKGIFEACEEKALGLLGKVKDTISQLNSTSRRQRTWQAVKFTLERDETASLRQDIQDIQATLNLLLQSISITATASLEAGQSKLIAGINSIEARVNQIFELRMRDLNLATAQLGSEMARSAEPGLKAQAAAQHTTTVEIVFEPSQNKTLQPPDYNPTEHRVSPKLHTKSRAFRTQWTRDIVAPSFNVKLASRSYAVTTIQGTETIESTETATNYVIKPNAIGRLFGMTRGITIESSSITGWKYSIQAFREVPSDSLVFEFARKGNKDAVKALFQRGDASPWDRDPQGRTPLWFAAEHLQLEIAELLINEGADLHAGEWRSNNEPIFATVNSKEINVRPKLEMIRLLQRHSGSDYRDETYAHMVGLSMLAYRPQKDINMKGPQRRDAVHQLLSSILPSFHSKHPYIKYMLLESVQLYYEQNVLRRLLCMIDGPIDVPEKTESIVYDALHVRLLHRDPAGMREIMERTGRLHTVMRKTESSKRDGVVVTECLTPTLLALYDMDTFLPWRQMLKGLGIDVKTFVDDEFVESGEVLKQNGWVEKTFTALFEVKVESGLERSSPKTHFGFPTCERCGDQGTTLGARLKVDLEWRRRLREVKSGKTPVSALSTPSNIEATDGEVVAASTSILNGDSNIMIGLDFGLSNTKAPAIINVQEVEEDETQELRLPYRIVCSKACTDGVCVAWVFEGDNVDDSKVVFPPYPLPPSHRTSDSDLGRVVGILEEVEHENLPTKAMPGAFID